MNLNIEQKDFCQSKTQNIRLLAPAGSGKTISLLWRCKWINENINKKDRFLIFTFTQVARDELLLRLNTNSDFGKIRDKVRVSTLNQWGYNYIKSQQKSLKLYSKSNEKYFLIENILLPLWLQKPHLSKIGEKRMKPFYSEIIDMLDILKSLGFKTDFNDKKIENHISWLAANGLGNYFGEKIINRIDELGLANKTQKDTIKRFKPFFRFWKNATSDMWERSIITLDDQKFWATEVLNQKVTKSKNATTLFKGNSRYNHILIDEFQDINPLDLELIEKLSLANESSITIVGDDDQAIFEWRGASPNFIIEPEKYFNRTFETHILKYNYRSPKNIVESSQKLIKNNTKRVDKDISAVQNNKAKIVRLHYNTHTDSLNDILQIAQEVNNGNDKTLAVLSRKQGQLIPLQILLTSQNIPFFAKEDLNIFHSKAFEDLLEIMQIVATKSISKSPYEQVNSLVLLCNRIGKYELNKKDKDKLNSFFTSLIVTNTTIEDTITTLQQNSYNAITLRLKDRILNDKLKKTLDYSSFREVLNCNSVSNAIEKIGEIFKGLQKHFPQTNESIFYKDPPFLYLSEYAGRYGNDFDSFLTHLRLAINQISLFQHVADNEQDEDINIPVHLMTSLRAKGKEFDYVVILDVVNDIWPIKFAETDEQLEQERRLFYVAMTRAKKELRLITVNQILNTTYLISPYIEEMGDWIEINQNTHELNI